MDKKLSDVVVRSAAAVGHDAVRLYSGATHDSVQEATEKSLRAVELATASSAMNLDTRSCAVRNSTTQPLLKRRKQPSRPSDVV